MRARHDAVLGSTFALLLSNFSMLTQSQVLDLALPTDNDALFRHALGQRKSQA